MNPSLKIVSRRWLCFLTVFILSASASINAVGQDWAREELEKSPRHGEWVVVEQGDRKIDCFVVYPEVADPAMSVVVIHEIFGMTDWVRTVADQLAAEGYIAIAPDLLSGMGPAGGNSASFENTDGARQAIGKLPPDQITADLNAAVQYVTNLPAANGKVVACGYCWGGSQVFRFATNNSKILAAFPFYGTAPTEVEELSRIACPVYGFYGENDNRVNSTLEATAKLMTEAGKTFEPIKYAGAGHGFMRAGQAPDGSPENATGRTDAWDRWRVLLKQIDDQETVTAEPEMNKESAMNFKAIDIQGNEVNIADYHGQVLMIVNVASKCGLTKQYTALQEVYDKYQDKGLVVLGFPCNQFLGQEPGSNEEIAKFCTTNFNVSFPMFSKIDVNGDGADPMYQYLTSLELQPTGKGDISWNFEKFLIGRDGKPAARFAPRTVPDAPEVIEAIEAALAKE